jgi:preprotein translocase subunit SecG
MVLLIIICVFMIIVILMQASKGTGLSGAFGGAGGVGTMFGVRKAADFLSRATWMLAIAFTLLCIAINVFFLPTGATEESIIRRSADEQPLAPIPAQQTPPTQSPPPNQQQPPAQQP